MQNPPSVEGNEDVSAFDDLVNKERVRMHRQLYSAISHDLKTPLASTIGALEIYLRMKDKLPLEKQNALILTALQEAYRLDNFVTNILDMGKLENDMVTIRKESFDLGRCLKGCLSNLESRMTGSDVAVEALSGDIAIMSDQSLLCRAVTLLLDNAVKYGGITPVIRIQYGQREQGYYFIDILDNGLGVPEAQKENIFSKYTRFVKRDQQHAGTGLGLAICREIMRLLHGTVAVANRPDHSGAVLSIRLPA